MWFFPFALILAFFWCLLFFVIVVCTCFLLICFWKNFSFAYNIPLVYEDASKSETKGHNSRRAWGARLLGQFPSQFFCMGQCAGSRYVLQQILDFGLSGCWKKIFSSLIFCLWSFILLDAFIVPDWLCTLCFQEMRWFQKFPIGSGFTVTILRRRRTVKGVDQVCRTWMRKGRSRRRNFLEIPVGSSFLAFLKNFWVWKYRWVNFVFFLYEFFHFTHATYSLVAKCADARLEAVYIGIMHRWVLLVAWLCCRERVDRYESRHAGRTGLSDEELEQLYLDRLDAGLYTLQRIVLVIADVCVNGSSVCRARATKLLQMRKGDGKLGRHLIPVSLSVGKWHFIYWTVF